VTFLPKVHERLAEFAERENPMFGHFRLPSSACKPQQPALPRLVVVLSAAALAVSTSLISIGCDSNSTFLPPPPDGLRDSASVDSIDLPAASAIEGTASGARSIEMILDRRDPSEITGVLTAARTQAGIDKVRLRPKVLGDAEPPSQQVELVREALARHPLALILEPADPSDARLAEALQKAQADGIPVVLLNRPLAAKAADAPPKQSTAPKGAARPGPADTPESAGSSNLVLVAPPSFTQSARQLVASAIRNAKNARLDPQGGAVVLVNQIGDTFNQERATAIRNALKDAGIKTVEEISFSKSPDAGAKLLKQKLTANPKLVLVFAIDGLSTTASRQVMTELIPDRLFVQSAYASDGNYTDMIRIADFAAVAAFAPNRVVRKAISTAVSLSQGRSVPARVEVPVEVHDSDEKSTTPQSPVYYRAKSAAKKAP
jgi:ABC-type sugar transport system substrate-binding protein